MGKEAGKDQVNIETLKAGGETIAKQLAKLYTKCITERRIPKTWKEANMVILLKTEKTSNQIKSILFKHRNFRKRFRSVYSAKNQLMLK